MLGTSESVSGFDSQFLALDKRWKLFSGVASDHALLFKGDDFGHTDIRPALT